MVDQSLFNTLGVDGLRHLASRQSDDPEVHFMLGLALSDSGDLQDAVDSFIEAQRLDTEGRFPVVHFLAKAYAEQGNPDTAQRVLKSAVEEDPESIFASHSHFLLGEIYEKRGELDLAKDAYLDAVKSDILCQEFGAHEALSRLSMNQDLELPKPPLRSELVTDQVCESESEMGEPFSFRVRVFQGPDFKVVLTSATDSKPVGNMNHLEGEFGIGTYLQDELGIDLFKTLWVDHNPRVPLGPTMEHLYPTITEEGVVEKIEFRRLPEVRFEALTGYRVDWTWSVDPVAIDWLRSDWVDSYLQRDIAKLLETTSDEEFFSRRRSSESRPNLQTFAFDRNSGELIAHAAIDRIQPKTPDPDLGKTVFLLSDLVVEGDKQSVLEDLVFGLERFHDHESSIAIFGDLKVFGPLGFRGKKLPKDLLSETGITYTRSNPKHAFLVMEPEERQYR